MSILTYLVSLSRTCLYSLTEARKSGNARRFESIDLKQGQQQQQEDKSELPTILPCCVLLHPQERKTGKTPGTSFSPDFINQKAQQADKGLTMRTFSSPLKR